MTGITTGNLDASNGGIVQIGHGNQMTVNYQKSHDWQDFLIRRDELQELTQALPNNPKYRQSLAELLRKMDDFKRDVLKLAEDITKIPLNTERLKQAVHYFEAGEYAKARAVLDVPELVQEQDSLLLRQQQLNAQQAELQASLDDKASEFMLLAQLLAIDYSLGEQRIAKTSEAFEQALKSGRTPKRLFDYAVCLQENNQFKPAEDFYTAALDILRKLAVDNPSVYLPDVAITLNNLGALVAADNTNRKEAEILYTEALASYRKLAVDNPNVYLPDVAMTLNNLGVLVSADSTRRKKAEMLYTEALDIRRKLAEDNPSAYLPDVAMTLNNLGTLVSVDSIRSKDAETLYTEALASYRKLASGNPSVYLPYVSATLNNLGLLIAADSTRRTEAETLYTEALDIRLKLAEDNPSVYLPYVAMTLNNPGILVSADSIRCKEAETFYTEALNIRRKLAVDNPSVYLPDVATTLNNLGLLLAVDSTHRKEAETLYTEALGIRLKLAADNPSVYLPDVAKTLGGFGLACLRWGEPDRARVYLQEAADTIQPFAAQHPNVYGGLQNTILHHLAESSSTTQ